MEERSLAAGEKRIKFKCKRIGSISELLSVGKDSRKQYHCVAEQLSGSETFVFLFCCYCFYFAAPAADFSF